MAFTEKAAKGLALWLREAADSADGSHNDLQKWLADAVQDCKPAGCWCYLLDFIGDAESGDVLYCCDGDLTKAPYAIKKSGDKISVKIDMAQAKDVLQVTSYVEEMPDGEYAGMESAKLYTTGAIPLCERTVTKQQRAAADSGSFAGKGKSFPILKKADVMAAVRSIGRAGTDNYSPDKIKANIKTIATKKGFASELPDSWKESATALSEVGARNSAKDMEAIQAVHDHSVGLGAKCGTDPADTTEAAPAPAANGIRLIETAVAAEPIVIREAARSDYEIKLIAPGRGSSAYYTPEVLKRDGPAVFPAHTKIFLNHATAAEEAARPEGDVKDLAGVLTTAAKYYESHPKGEGLYARGKFFSDHAQTVEEKAPFVGMSIRGYGDVAKEAGKPVMREGVPLLARLTAARSVDVVTEAGAGGMILTEAARAATTQTNQGDADMDAAEFTKLQESNAALLSEVKKMRERQFVGDALAEAKSYFSTVRVGPVIEDKILRRLEERFSLPGGLPLDAASALDKAKVKTLTEAETKDELAFLGRLNPGLVRGMGAAPATTPLTEAQTKEQRKSEKKALKESERRFASLMGFGDDLSKAGRRVLTEGRRAFDVSYNAREHGKLTQLGGELPMIGGE